MKEIILKIINGYCCVNDLIDANITLEQLEELRTNIPNNYHNNEWSSNNFLYNSYERCLKSK